MNQFSGFPEGKVKLTPIPEQFFNHLLADIDHLGELKVTLYALWRLSQVEGIFRYLRRADFLEDKVFMQGMGTTPQEAETSLDVALDRAERRGTFLKAMVRLGEEDEGLYFLNSPKGRAAVQAISRGEWRPSGEAQMPVALGPEAPNVFRLYEEHIGPLSPMIAEKLQDAENTYSAQWIEDAIRIAVENNVRRWHYVEAILKRWQEEGRDERKDRRDTEKARRRYAEWEEP